MQDNLFEKKDDENLEYKVLARKYRPKVFGDIISQSHVTRIIKNSIDNNKIHHAYILTGIRGVGKTTFARILSKALNCTKNEDNKPTFEPCLTCKNCVSIEESRHQDVLEIDAASNTGVADIREIIENAKYKPITARYKVYIIDEVHMLSNSAFNALLKTLEEPPEHVKFVLATTEIKKIPLTVISRCQRFDLHRLTIEELANYLQSIAKKEGFEINERASMLISKAAGGSARDGLSLLDQAILTCKESIIDLESITQMLGIISLEYVYDLFDLVLTGKLNDALSIARGLYTKGAEPFMILQELIEISYKISLCKIGDAKNLIMSDFELQKCNFIAEKTSIIILTRFWQILNKAFVDMRISYNEMLSLEMTIIKMIYVNLTITPEEILKSLGDDSDGSSKSTQPNVSQDVKKNFLI